MKKHQIIASVRRAIFILGLLSGSSVSVAQTLWIDSTRAVLAQQQDTTRVNTLTSMSHYYSYSEPDSGLVYAQKALTLAEKLQFDKGIFWAIVSLHRSLFVLGNYSLQLDYALKALPIARKLNDRYALGWSMGMICDSYLTLGDFESAMIYARQVMTNIERYFPNELYSGYASMVPIYIGLNKNDSALIAAKKSLVLLRMDHVLFVADNIEGKIARNLVYTFLGQGFEVTQQYDSALYYFRQAMPLAIATNSEMFTIYSLTGIAKSHKEKNNPDSAVWYVRAALANRLTRNYPAANLKATKLLADIFESEQRPDSSLKYLRISLQLNDTLYAREKTKAFQQSLSKEEEKQKEIRTVTAALRDRYRLYLLGGLVILSGIIATIIIRNRRIRQMQKMRNSIADDLHDDIGSSLSSIHIMSELAKASSPEARPLLDSIGENAVTIQENMSDIVWAVNPKNDRFENVLQRMHVFAAGILDARNIVFEFKTDPSLANSRLSMNQRKSMYLFFKEAINNAAKHSAATTVSMQISKKDNYIAMRITDDGKGFQRDGKYNGNGLSTLQKRGEELSGRFEIRSGREGTTILLRFKIE